MADKPETPEELKKQDAALKQMQAVLAKLEQQSAVTKSSAAKLQKSLEAENDEAEDDG